VLGALDAARAMTDNFRELATGRSITLEGRHAETLLETIDRLRREVADLRASRKRLVMAADDDRRTIERDLHGSVQQHLVALAVNLQLGGGLADADPAAAKALLEEMGRDVQQALDETAQLAQRIYPSLLEARGLAAALRSAAVIAGVPASVEVPPGVGDSLVAARTVYFCWLEALEHAGAGARATIRVRDEEEALAFEVVEDGARSAAETAPSDTRLERLRERVEALGGRLTIQSDPGRGTRVSGSLPLSW
jgi:signal transduction histidine kinase